MASTQTPLSIIQSVVQFQNGTASVWNGVNVPIPQGVVVIATDTLDVKIGDGSTLYVNLPILFNINNILTITNSLSTQAQQIAALTTAIATVQFPQRLICETTTNSDGLSISLPWNVDSVAALDVSIGGSLLDNSSLTLSNENVLVLSNVVSLTQPVRIVWNAIKTSSGRYVSEISTITLGSGNSGGSGGGTGDGTGGGGSGGNGGGGTGETAYYLPDGSTFFTSNGAASWLSTGSGVLSSDTVFQSLPASTWLPSGNGFDPSVDVMFAGLNASTWA